MPGRSGTHLSSKRHGPHNPQRRVIPVRTQILKLRRRPHVHGGKRRNPHQQRGSPQNFPNNPGSHVICSGGRTGRPIHQCKNSRFNVTNAHRTWTSAAPNPDAKLTMQQHTRYSPTKFYQKHLKPWTCASTGYGAMILKANSVITGNLGRRTWQITSQSITQPHTTRVYALPY